MAALTIDFGILGAVLGRHRAFPGIVCGGSGCLAGVTRISGCITRTFGDTTRNYSELEIAFLGRLRMLVPCGIGCGPPLWLSRLQIFPPKREICAGAYTGVAFWPTCALDLQWPVDRIDRSFWHSCGHFGPAPGLPWHRFRRLGASTWHYSNLGMPYSNFWRHYSGLLGARDRISWPLGHARTLWDLLCGATFAFEASRMCSPKT